MWLTSVQLLYDLFFAANMTAFSNIHDTTSVERLVAYVGYFASVSDSRVLPGCLV